MTENDLLTELEREGMVVETTPLPGTCRGLYVAHKHLVVIRPGLTYAQRRSTLAHELVHVLRNDDGHQSKKVEQKVNRDAADLLISAPEYELAEKIHGSNIAGIAQELDVATFIVEAYRETLFRRAA